MDNSLMRVEDVAARLNLSPRRVSAMIREKALPACRVGRFVRVPTAALECYLAAKTAEALGEAVIGRREQTSEVRS